MSSSATNHVTGLENGSASGWWPHTVPEASGSGSGTGSSSSSSWSGGWNNSYDETASYPGFSELRYYGRDYGGGAGEGDYLAYIGEVFYDNPGSDTGFFPSAYSHGEECSRVMLGATSRGDFDSTSMEAKAQEVEHGGLQLPTRDPGRGDSGLGNRSFVVTTEAGQGHPAWGKSVPREARADALVGAAATQGDGSRPVAFQESPRVVPMREGSEAESPEDRFREAARRNGVPSEIIEIIIAAARNTVVPPPPRRGVHSYCEDWVDAFRKNLHQALNAAGYRNGLKAATNGGIVGPEEKQIFRVPPGATGQSGLWGWLIGQDHTTVKITFKDGTVFYVDCGTLSALDINNLTRGKSHFSSSVPGDWKAYPLKPKKPQQLWPSGPYFLPTKCFPTGTMVQTPSGVMPIEGFLPGDPILAYDFNKRRMVLAHVEGVARFVGSHNLMSIWLSSRGQINVTTEHPLFDGWTWVLSRHVQPGQHVFTASGALIEVVESRLVGAISGEVYNLQTSAGSYLVGGEGVVVADRAVLSREGWMLAHAPNHSSERVIARLQERRKQAFAASFTADEQWTKEYERRA